MTIFIIYITVYIFGFNLADVLIGLIISVALTKVMKYIYKSNLKGRASFNTKHGAEYYIVDDILHISDPEISRIEILLEALKEKEFEFYIIDGEKIFIYTQKDVINVEGVNIGGEVYSISIKLRKLH